MGEEFKSIDSDAESFLSFYIDLFENHVDTLPYHLSEDALLDWFGQTVRDVKKIGEFLKHNVGSVKHLFTQPEVCDSVGYRESHTNFIPRKTRKRLSPVLKNQDVTPPSGAGVSKKTTHKHEGDSDEETPPKRTKLSFEPDRVVTVQSNSLIENEDKTDVVEIKNISAEGHVEFHRKSSKKYQRETKWLRPCKLQIKFSKSLTGYTIHMMIYEGNMRCRRNLLKEFDAADSDDK